MCDLKFGPNAMWEKRIRHRAYEIYEARLQSSCLSSNELQDWLEAERTVLQEIQGTMVYLLERTKNKSSGAAGRQTLAGSSVAQPQHRATRQEQRVPYAR